MKIRNLFELVQDSKDVLDFFEGVESPEQMISALERIKKRESEDFLTCVQTLRISLEQLVDDTLELSGFGPDDEEEDLETDDLELGEDLPDSEEPVPPSVNEDPK